MIGNIFKNDQLPKGWVPTTIGDLLYFEYGKGLTKKKRNENGKFPVYGSNGIVGYHTNFLIEAPALIIGRKGAAGEVSYSDKNCWPIDTTYFINNLNYLNIKFVFYVLKSLRLNQYDRSTAIPGLNRNDAYGLSFNLPPLPEQNHIVAKIEELFSELDNGIENLKKAREQLKTYRQAVLKYAFEGKLTKEWRSRQIVAGNPPEPAEKLLEQIKTEREKHYQKQLEDWKKACGQAKKEGKKKPVKPKKPKELQPLKEMELADFPELPEGWCWCKLEEISYKITDGEHFRPKTIENGIYFLSAKDIRDSGVSFEDPLYVSEETAYKARLRCGPERGDILIVSRGATVGRMCVVNTDKTFCLLGSVILIKVNKHVNSNYLSYIIKSPFIQKNLFDISGSTAQQAIYLRDIKNVPISIPSYLEQNQIVSGIESRLSVCDKLEQTIEDSLKKAEALRQSILKKAFEGNLTRDWRAKHPELITGENSAEKLLERIKAEKEKTRKDSPQRRKEKRKKVEYSD
ncbi:MAG: restriction endonuclease subunit S [Pseudomonadota bacterium]